MRIKPTWSRIIELDIHTDGLKQARINPGDGLGGVRGSRRS